MECKTVQVSRQKYQTGVVNKNNAIFLLNVAVLLVLNTFVNKSFRNCGGFIKPYQFRYLILYFAIVLISYF